MDKKCSRCKIVKPIEEFPKDSSSKDKSHHRCKECQYTILNAKNREGIGFTKEIYDYFFLKQSGKCAICGKEKSKSGKSLSADHDHASKKPRGLLCTSCNIALGYFNDDTKLLARAIEYLKQDESFGFAIDKS